MAAQWGPDIGPPGPVSYILHVMLSQGNDPESSGEDSGAATGNGDDSPDAEAPVETQPASTSTFDNVSESTTTPTSSETSAAIPSTTDDTSDIPSTSQDTFSSTTSDPPTSANDWPIFSLDTSTTSSVSSSSTGGFSYDPIGSSISYAPITSSTSSSSTSSSPTSTRPTAAGDLGTHATDSSSSSDMMNMSNARKQAIVGGLAGAIGALVLVGLLLCFCLRRRHRRTDDDDDAEDGLKKDLKPPRSLAKVPSTVRLWNNLGRSPARSTPEISKPRTPSPVDGSIIRVSTEHWSRPFVRKEGLRDSLEPAPLRVINSGPDSSRSSTPQEERHNGFVRKQRSALAAFLQDGSRSNSRNAVKRGPISYPKPMVGDPKYSSKATVDSVAETQSVGSLPSDTSSPMVVQQPPEDPFYASNTMLSTMEEVAPPPDTNTSNQPELGRTVSHFGKNANPFRTQIVPSVALPPRIFSYSNPNMRASNMRPSMPRRSSIGSSYSDKTRRDTACTLPRASDQFDLMISPDQMPPASGILAKAAEYEEREREKKEVKKTREQQQQQREETPAADSSPNWKVYEGT